MSSERQNAFELLVEMDRRSQERRIHYERAQKESGRWQYIRYRVGDSRFITSIGDVIEILPLAKVTPVPFTKPWIKGVTNLRGDVYVVTDFSYFLFEKPLTKSKKNKLIILKGSSHAAILVDEIIGMTDVSQDEILDDIEGADSSISQFVGGSLEKDGVRYFVMDVHSLLSETSFIHAAVS